MRARRFVEAFSAAAHDVRLEKAGYEIFHFFDSDFLSRLIFGYRDSLNQALIREAKERPHGNAGQRLLMGALVGQGIGAPPRMRALLPHLYEVRRSVEGPRSHEPRYSVPQAIADLGIVQSLNDLKRALAASTAADDLFNQFIEQGPQIFYGAELLSGRWESRLGRVLSLGVGEPGPFEDASEVVDGEAFEVLARHVVHTQEARGGGGVSGLRDAMALATLARAVSDGAGRRIGRFYTETPRIHNAWREHAEVRALLTYHAPAGAGSDADYGEHGVLRTVDYYLIRALIPELGYPHPDADDDVSANAAAVYQITDELAEATRELERGGIRGTELSEVRIGTSTLGDFMEEVTDLSLYGSAWRSLMERIPPGLPGTLVAQLEEVIAGERRRAGDLEASFSKHIRDLSTRTRDVGEFTETYVHLHDVLSRWNGALRPRFGNYSEHVGLTRWGLIPSPADERALQRLIELYGDWMAERQPARAEQLSTSGAGLVIELAQRLRDMKTAPMSGPEYLPDCVALLGFLWLVEDYRSIVRYGPELRTGIRLALAGGTGAIPPEALQDERWNAYGRVVEILCGAAEVAAEIAKLRGPPRGEPADALLALTRRVVAYFGESDMFGAGQEVRAIAQGYVTFHTWLAFNRTVMAEGWTTPIRPRQPALVRESLEVCFEALDTCDRESAAYPLLLNHCVYVASMARRVDDRIRDMAKQLMLIKLSEQQSLSYRLDDTLGYYFFAQAAMTLARDPGLQTSAIQDLREARRWLDNVPYEVSDPQVVAHRGLLRDLERALGL